MSGTTATFETASAAETEALAARLGAALRGGMVLALAGELGAGKTVFVRGLARGLGMPRGVAVTSPTYVLQHIYRGGRLTLYHLDVYRVMSGAAECEASGLLECFSDPHGVVCVEWPEHMADFAWPADRVLVHIEHVSPEVRRILLQAAGAGADHVLAGVIMATRKS